MNPPATQPMVRRCLWCKNRIGAARYFMAGGWTPIPFPQPFFFGGATFTDGICESCLAGEKAKLK